MDGGLENRCVGRVYGADGAVHHPHRTHDLHDMQPSSFPYNFVLLKFELHAQPKTGHLLTRL